MLLVSRKRKGLEWEGWGVGLGVLGGVREWWRGKEWCGEAVQRGGSKVRLG